MKKERERKHFFPKIIKIEREGRRDKHEGLMVF